MPRAIPVALAFVSASTRWVLPEEAANLVAAKISRLRNRPLVLAIDGASGAGTSTLAAAVSRQLGASVVAGDDFYRDMPAADRWALTAAQGADRYFDWDRLRRSAIEPLRSGEEARYRPFSWLPGGGLANQIVIVPATPIVIVEGVYTARPELSDLVDLAVLVQTPEGERRRRLLARGHDNECWWSRWAAAEAYYFTHVRPNHSFDLVVPGG